MMLGSSERCLAWAVPTELAGSSRREHTLAMRRSASRKRSVAERLGRVSLVAAALLGVRTAAASAPTQTVLEWDAPAGCPSGDALQQSLVDSLGEPLHFGRLDHVRGAIERRASEWLLRLELVEAGRERTRFISAERCADLADAAALAIQLAVTSVSPPATQGALGAEQTSATESLGIASAPHPDAARDTGQDPEEPNAIAPKRLARAGWSAGVSAAFVLDLNSLSQATPGATLAGRLRWDRLELGLFGLWLAPARVAVSGGEAVDFSLIAGGPRGCYQLFEGALDGQLCAAFEVGRFGADGTGLSRDERRFSQWWLAPSVGFELLMPLSRLLVAEGGVEALRPLVRHDYGVNATELVYAAPLLGARLQLGLRLLAE